MIIDIVVRNLFERTADVGFLAMDEAIRQFILAGPQGDRHAIVARLDAYRQKYTVYDEIFILDPQGRVLANLDPAHPIGQSHDPLVARTLAATGAEIDVAASAGKVREFATVLIDDAVFALPAGNVIEAIEASRMLSTSTFKPVLAGALDYHEGGAAASVFVPVVDMRQLLLAGGTAAAPTATQAREIVIVRHAGSLVGLLVDGLHDVLEFGESHIDAPLLMFGGGANYIGNLIRTARPGDTIQVVDVERIVMNFFGPRKQAYLVAS